jgi:tetratricopeptide (TPR) repeat protein
LETIRKISLALLLGCFTAVTLSNLPAIAGANSESAAKLFAAGNYKAAQPLFETLVKNEPKNVRARYYLGLVYLNLARRDLARIQFQQVISLAPASDEARFSDTVLARMDPKPSAPPVIESTTSSSAKVDQDLVEATAQADAIRAHAKSESDSFLAQANKTAKEMEALPAAGRGSHGSAYSQDSINTATADLRRQAADALERGNREANDILNRAQLRHDAGAQVAGNVRSIGSQTTAPASAKEFESKVDPNSGPNDGGNSDVPRIDELAYWRQLKNVSDRQELHQALMLKPQYRAEYLSGRSIVSDIMQKHYFDSDKAADERWIASHQSLERSFKTEIDPPVAVAGYGIQQFVGYRSGSGRFYDKDGICYKVFFDFTDPTRDLTPELYLQFVRALAKAGFVGDSKVAMTPGFVRFNYNDIIVHAGSPANARLAERVGLNILKGRLAHRARGVDVMQSGDGAHWSDPIDWHNFLSTSSDLSRLSPTALKWVNYSD